MLTMRLLANAAAMAAAMTSVSAMAACPLPAFFDGSGKPAPTLSSARYLLVYRTQPALIPVGQHFTMEVAMCAKPNAPAPETFRVDARMPEHRHGMNYRPTVRSRAPASDAGDYTVEGLMFHMNGRWEFTFEIGAAGQTDRITHRVEPQ